MIRMPLDGNLPRMLNMLHLNEARYRKEGSVSRLDSRHGISDTDEAVQALRCKGVHLWMENGTLRYRARKGLVTAKDIAILRRADSALLSLLLERDGTSRFEPCLLRRMCAERAPLAFSQLAHWCVRTQAGGRPVRQVASATYLRGRLDETALKEALAVVVSRHESLRTQIVIRDEDLMQEVVGSRCRLQVYDLGTIRACDRAIEIQRQIASAMLEVADYARDPLFQPVLLRFARDEHIVILALDHMVSDGASLSILLDELLVAHTQLVEGHSVSLPVVEMQLSDYAYWQRAVLAGGLKRQAAAQDGWRRTSFPEVPAGQRRGWQVIRFIIDSRRKELLQELARRSGTSLVMMVLTVYVAFVLRQCEVSETIIQVMFDGRTNRSVENTIGYLAFPLYLNISFDGRGRFRDLLEVVTAEYCKACERPDFYYSYAQHPCPEFTRNTCFNWLPRREGSARLRAAGAASLTYSPVTFENPFLETLDWDAEPWAGLHDAIDMVVVEVGFPRQRFSHPTMERLTANFNAFVDAIMTTPAACIREVPMS